MNSEISHLLTVHSVHSGSGSLVLGSCNCCEVANFAISYVWYDVHLRWFFEVFTPYFNEILMLTERWVDFIAKIDLCSKLGYIISKIGKSPPKSISSFPNRDPLLFCFKFSNHSKFDFNDIIAISCNILIKNRFSYSLSLHASKYEILHFKS